MMRQRFEKQKSSTEHSSENTLNIDKSKEVAPVRSLPTTPQQRVHKTQMRPYLNYTPPRPQNSSHSSPYSPLSLNRQYSPTTTIFDRHSHLSFPHHRYKSYYTQAALNLANSTAKNAISAASTSVLMFSPRRKALQRNVLQLCRAILPSFLASVEIFQYHQAITNAMNTLDQMEIEWSQLPAFKLALKLIASVESTYYCMKYLDTTSAKTLSKLYDKLLVLLTHILEEVQIIAHFPAPSSTNNKLVDKDASEEETANHDLTYYVELLDHLIAFFTLRRPILQVYQHLSTPGSHDYSSLLMLIDDMASQYTTLDHPIIAKLSTTARLEVLTLQIAIETEQNVSSYAYLKSIISLHSLKSAMCNWSDHFDLLMPSSEFTLEEEKEYDMESDIDTKSPKSSKSHSALQRLVAHRNTFLGHVKQYNPSAYLLGRSGTYTPTTLLRRLESTDSEDVESDLEHNNKNSVPMTPHSNSGLVSPRPIPMQSFATNGSQSSVSLTSPSAFYLKNYDKKQGESGITLDISHDKYVLPVYQWCRLFYYSLLAKFTFYFSQYLQAMERRAPISMLRSVQNPVLGLSYLDIIDRFLAKTPHKDDSAATVLLVLETNSPDGQDKTSFYSPDGYQCPEKVPYPESKNLRQRYAAHSFVSHEFRNKEFSSLQGLSGWPAVFCARQTSSGEDYEAAPLQHWPNLVSLILDQREAIYNSPTVFSHTERYLKTIYYITEVDPSLFLVVILEGKRKIADSITQDVMLTLKHQFQHQSLQNRPMGVAVSPLVGSADASRFPSTPTSNASSPTSVVGNGISAIATASSSSNLALSTPM